MNLKSCVVLLHAPKLHVRKKLLFCILSDIRFSFYKFFKLQISIVTWIIGSLIMAINIYYLLTSFIKLLLHSRHLIVAKVFLGILGVLGMAVCMAGIAYLVFHKNNKGATHLLALNNTPQGQEMESEQGNGLIYSLPREDIVSMQLPQ